MLPKPEPCVPCTEYGDGLGFVPDEIVEGAEVLILGQNPGADEERLGRPFVGDTGQMQEKDFFPLAGLERGRVSIANTLRCRRQIGATRDNKMPSGKRWEGAVGTCLAAHFRVPPSTRLIVAQGAHAWRALGGPGKITDWRGHLAPEPYRGVPVYGVMHLAEIFRKPVMEWVALLDWRKIPRILCGEWPLQSPPICLVNEEQIVTAEGFFLAAHALAKVVVLDTEYDPDDGILTMVGLAFRGEDGIKTLQVKWLADHPEGMHRWFRKRLDALMREVPIVMHNALADVPALQTNMGIAEWGDFKRLEDTMQAHAVLWCELPHTLEFVGSIYGQYPKAKHLQHVDLARYNQGDLLDTLCAWEAMDEEFQTDPASRRVYETQMRCLPHIDEATRVVGLRVNKERVPGAIRDYSGKMDEASAIAHAYCGWPINLNSDEQLKQQVYTIEKMPVQRDPETKQPTIDKDAVAVLRARFLPFDPEEKPSVASALSRIAEGAHPLLEARFLHSNAAQCMSHYLAPLLVRDLETGKVLRITERIHHEIHLHAQKNARWSYVDPPLAQTPDDLEDLYLPDPGWPWFGWDWDQIELIEVATECQDPRLLLAIRNGWDVHTMTCVAMFALPVPPSYVEPSKNPECAAWREQVRWQGKTDPRRVFAKRYRHRRSYGGTARRAGEIPGARTLGLTRHALVRMAHAEAALFPRLTQWQREFVERAMERGETRTWFGRRRRYLSHRGVYKKGEMLDQPMQAGVQDIAMLTFLEIKDRFGADTIFKYGKHDSQKWAIRRDRFDEITPEIRRIVTQARNIHGVMVEFPATFHEAWAPEDRRAA